MIKIMLRKNHTALVRRLYFTAAMNKAYQKTVDDLVKENEELRQQLNEITDKYCKLTDRDEKGRFVK